MSTLYRAVSQNERNDYFERKEFRIAKNTLDAKQFFKSRIAIKQFVESSVRQTLLDYSQPGYFILSGILYFTLTGLPFWVPGFHRGALCKTFTASASSN